MCVRAVYMLMHLADCCFLLIPSELINQNLIDPIKKGMMCEKLVVYVRVCLCVHAVMHLDPELQLIYLPISCALLILIKGKRPPPHFCHPLSHTNRGTHTLSEMLSCVRCTCCCVLFCVVNVYWCVSLD